MCSTSSLAVLLGAATDEVLGGLELLAGGAEEARATSIGTRAMIGRSHGIHAEPVTLGIVFAGFYAEARRNRRRLVAARENIAVGKIAGAVGTYANVSPDGREGGAGRARAASRDGGDAGRARDRHAELFDALALVGAGVERTRDPGPPLAAHRGRRGGGGVRQGAKGLLGDAAQEEPDPAART